MSLHNKPNLRRLQAPRLLFAALALMGPVVLAQPPLETEEANAPWQEPAFDGQTRAPEMNAGVTFQAIVIADGLEFPWAVEFLPDERFLVTERPGRLRIVEPDGTVSAPLAGLPAIQFSRQGGVLDVALDPDFANNNLVYLSFSEATGSDASHTALARGRLVTGANPKLDEVEVIYRQSPSVVSPFHFGSRIVFAADGTVLMIQGERGAAQYREQSQQLDSLLGKLVRINTDGSVPADNPFVATPGARGEIWSYGHRNSSAMAFRPGTDELWVIEHGARGGDEINIIERGANYGWPDAAYGVEYQSGQAIGEGLTTSPGSVQPIYYWDPVIAPGGMGFYQGELIPEWQGSLFVTGLNSMYLARLTLDGQRVIGEERLLEDWQVRWRDVAEGPDGALYLTTDPCGNGRECTDEQRLSGKLIKLVPAD